MHRILIFILFISLTALPAVADEKTEVSNLLQSKIDQVVLLLQDKVLEKPARNARIIEVVTPLFNYSTMAKLSLGKKHWPSLSKEKQSEFSSVFTERLQSSYLEKLDIYTDEKVLYGEPKLAGKKIHMPTTLVSKDNQIEILYKFYRSKSGWKVYDVEVGGVSVIQTYRSQFDDVLSSGDIDDLLEKLKNDGAFAFPDSKEVNS